MGTIVNRILGTACALSVCGMLVAAESNKTLLNTIGDDLATAFNAVEPCGEKYDTCMDTLQTTLLDARAAADALMLPTIVPQKTRKLVEEVFTNFNATIQHLRGENSDTDRWHRPANKPEMQNLYNTLQTYPAVFKKFMAQLRQTAKTSPLTTPRNLTRNLAVSVEACLAFLDKILKKLDHYIHEPEEAPVTETKK